MVFYICSHNNDYKILKYRNGIYKLQNQYPNNSKFFLIIMTIKIYIAQ